MKIQKKWFTVVELVVVIMILITLSWIWFVWYMSNLVESRNVKRVSEIGNAKMALKNHKLQNSLYPNPGNTFEISDGSGTIALQWFLDQDVYLKDFWKIPTDPYVKNKYYVYSITANKNAFQLATILEKDNVIGNELGLQAYVDGDYQTSSIEYLPSLVVAASEATDISVDYHKFVVDKGTKNLAYDLTGVPYVWATDISEVLEEEGIEIPKYFWYASCEEISENWAYWWVGRYQITDQSTWNVACVDCDGTLWSGTGTFTDGVCD